VLHALSPSKEWVGVQAISQGVLKTNHCMQGNRDVIDGMAPGSSRVMNEVLKLIDAYDLYGSVAYPKKHTQVS